MTTLLRRAAASVRWARVIWANALSTLYGFVVPDDIMASGAKWANLAAATGKRTLVLNATVHNRLAPPLPTLVLGMTALLVDNPFTLVWVRPVMGIALAAAVTRMLLLWHPRLAAPTEAAASRLVRPLPLGVHDKPA